MPSVIHYYPVLLESNFRHREELHELLLVPSAVLHETEHKET